MTTRKRISLLLDFTNFNTFLIIALIYGLFFGGMMNIAEVINGETTLMAFIHSVVASGGGYFSFFTVAIILIFITLNTKLFKSFSVSEKLLLRMWHDLLLIITVVNTIIYLAIVRITVAEADYTYRILNLDLFNAGTLPYIILGGIVALGVLFLLEVLSLLGNIGNHYGPFFAIASGLVIIAIALQFGKPLIISIINWGTYLLPLLVATVLVTIILHLINVRLFRHIEVGR